jgi:hypothetical protein
MDDNGVLADRSWRAERRLGVRYLTLSIASRDALLPTISGISPPSITESPQ